jgi:hypothetical protein
MPPTSSPGLPSILEYDADHLAYSILNNHVHNKLENTIDQLILLVYDINLAKEISQ